MDFERIDPMTNKPASKAQAMTAKEAAAVADRAAAGFEAWSQLGPSFRRATLAKAAASLEARKDQFVAAMMSEVGATAGWAMFNIMLAAGMVREAGALTTQIAGEVIPSDKPGCLSMALREPVGVVLGIAPWNAPIILGVRAIAVPLACENTVILKASEVCPATHWLIGTVLNEAGLSEGVVNVITHDPKDSEPVAEALISHLAVKRINFTGSTRVGKIIAGLSAKYLKPALLELGCKAPLIVLEDADLDAAVDATVFGAFANSGQICMSTERVIVDERVADQFATKLAKRVAGLPVGDPRKGDFVLGSVVSRSTVERVQQLVRDAVGKGAKVLCGGESADGTIMKGIVVDEVTPDMSLFREESFGPQVSITRVRSD